MKTWSALQGWRAKLVVACALSTTSACAFLVESSVAFSQSAAASEVSVRLRPLKGTITIAGTGLTARDGAKTVFQAREYGRFTFKYSPSSELNPAGFWTIDDGTGKNKIVHARKIDVFGDSTRVDLRPAPPHVQLVARSTSSQIDLVAFMSLEEYLQGVVAGEVPRDWPIEALKAQAVAARSFTLAKILEREASAPDWLFEATVQDQVFDHERIHSRATDAVRATEGEVLFEGGIGHTPKIVAANYHSDCGGTTDEPGTVWGGRPTSNGTAKDAVCALKPRNTWRYVSDLTELRRKLSNHGLLPSQFQLASVSVARRSPGGRALNIVARSVDGKNQVFSGERLRAALGYSDLKSTLFNVNVTDTRSQIEFVGKGFGHGTGLCQWGARTLAANGRSYREILQHYYPRLLLSDPKNVVKTEPQAVAQVESSSKL